MEETLVDQKDGLKLKINDGRLKSFQWHDKLQNTQRSMYIFCTSRVQHGNAVGQ